MPKMLDRIRMFQRGELPPPPVATLIGFTISSVEPGRGVMPRRHGDGRRASALKSDRHGPRRHPVRMILRGAQAEGR